MITFWRMMNERWIALSYMPLLDQLGFTHTAGAIMWQTAHTDNMARVDGYAQRASPQEA